MYRFFKKLRRGRWTAVWQARGSWEPKLLTKVAGDLGLLRASDPLTEPGAAPEGVKYFRLRGAGYTDVQLGQLRRVGQHGQAYLYFTHRRGWLEAKRLVGERR